MHALSPTDWATLASVATVLSGVAAVLWRSPLKRLARPVVSVLAHLDPLHGIKRDIAHITKELRPNGGSSLSDKVNAIWTRQGMSAATVGMLLDESEALLWQSDTEGRQVWASRALIEATGRPASELLGWGWLNVIHPEDRESFRKAWISCLVEGRIFEERCRLQTPQGRHYIGALVAKPFSFDGKVIAWIGRATIQATAVPELPHHPARNRRR